MCQMRRLQSIPGSRLCSDFSCPDTAPLLVILQMFSLSSLDFFKKTSIELSSGPATAKRITGGFSASIPSHPQTSETRFIYRTLTTGDCEGGRWQAGTNYLLCYWPRLQLASQLWGSNWHLPCSRGTEQSSFVQEPPRSPPTMTFA